MSSFSARMPGQGSFDVRCLKLFLTAVTPSKNVRVSSVVPRAPGNTCLFNSYCEMHFFFLAKSSDAAKKACHWAGLTLMISMGINSSAHGS